jgi:hypothetical protein
MWCTVRNKDFCLWCFNIWIWKRLCMYK